MWIVVLRLLAEWYKKITKFWKWVLISWKCVFSFQINSVYLLLQCKLFGIIHFISLKLVAKK